MNIPFLKYTFICSLLLAGSSVLAQDKKDDKTRDLPKEAITEEVIEVVRPYKPVLADAVKIRRSPDLSNNAPFKPILTYSILDKKLALNSNIRELEVQKLADEQQVLLKNNYVKIGAGNFNTGLGEIYLNSGQDAALQAGLYIKHLSQRGSINKQQFSNQQASAFGKNIGDKFTLSAKVSYDRKSSFFHGFNPAFPAPDADPDKQRFNLFEAEGEIMNNYSEDEDTLNYAVKLTGYLFNTVLDGKENSVVLSGYFNKAAANFHFGANTSVDFTSTKDPLYSIRNNIVRVNPYVKYKGDGFLLNLGLNLVQEFGGHSRLNILPAVSVEVPIAMEYATVFAGLNGDAIKTSLKDITSENLYLNNNITIRNSIEKMNIYGGIRGNAGSSVGFKAMAYYKSVDNLPLFVNNPSNISRFDIRYDHGKSTVIGFEGEINIKASDILSLTGKAQTQNYKLATEKEAWFKPAIRLISNARGQVNKKLSLDAEVIFNGETKAEIAPLPQQQIVTLKSYVDFSAGAEYKLNNKLGLYIRANNILGNTYQQYLYYPKLGLTITGGFNFSF